MSQIQASELGQQNAAVTVPPPGDGCPGGNCPPLQGTTTADNYVIVDIATKDNQAEYNLKPSEKIILDINVTKKRKEVASAVLTVDQYTIDGAKKEILKAGDPGSTITFNPSKSTEMVKRVLEPIESSTLEKGVYTYIAVVDPRSIRPEPPALPLEKVTIDNADAHSIKIKEVKAAVPEIPMVSVVFIVLAVMLVLRKST